ncbi:MAG: hypothetical protein RSD35_09230, partial [Oscillospiraceae bacterium]
LLEKTDIEKKTSCRRIETTIGGFAMPRSNRDLTELAPEIQKMREAIKTKYETTKCFGLWG